MTTNTPEPARDQPLIAIDVVPVTFDGTTVKVGTAERQYEPFAGEQALPGVLLAAGESLAEGAYRALRTKAGVGQSEVRHLRQVAAFDGPGRDPRTHAISIAFVAIVAPDAGADVSWSDSDEKLDLPFDHATIIAAALDTVRTRLWDDDELTSALTGPTFPTNTAAALTAAVTGKPVHAGNFHRELSNHGALSRVGEAPAAGRGRPATVWAWQAA